MMVGKTKRDDADENSGNKFVCGVGGVDLFDAMPEGCIAYTLSYTGPLDACRLATVSKIFKSAADSDAVWVRFLPSDYREIVARSDGGNNGLDMLDSISKRDLFFYLVDHPLLIDGSSMSFFLDKPTGKKCFTISAKKLAITWGDTPRYWAFRPLPESSRFPEVAELNSVCWLEIRGKMKTSMLSPNTTYVAYLVFKMTEGAYGFYSPAEVTVKTQGSKSETRKVYLQDEGGRNPRYQIVPRRMSLFNRIRTPFFEASPPVKKKDDKMLPNERRDGWQEVAIGEFTTRVGEDGEVEMSVLEVEAGNWKSGLIVEGMELRPKVVSE
ncbi:hypothetical protein RND81_04G217500 [Saponaria officinalis]|uniref:F-box domain-containing protein n=1 Tax=Saponaria officinalis TaxID=3572 RepID=A0AAW1LGY2_SAPOF